MHRFITTCTMMFLLLLPACSNSQTNISDGEDVSFPEISASKKTDSEKTSKLRQQQSFIAWRHAFIVEAQEKGIHPKLLAQAFYKMKPNKRVIELDRKQPEGTFSFSGYLERTVNPTRVKKGREMMRKHRKLLTRIGNKYGVQPRFIVALWGKETNYGSYTGGFSVVESLATLAWEGRRSEFFRKELLDALRIVQDGHIRLEDMKGSWAGAMGQTQFMPSSWWRFAVDEDGDGRKDIWNSQPDVFASIANYLRKSGWDDDLTWGRKVRLPAGFDVTLAGRDKTKTLQEWQRLGVRREDGSSLPNVNLTASIIYPDDEDRRQAYLVYNNYNVIMRWNRSLYFATAVGILADRVAY